MWTKLGLLFIVLVSPSLALPPRGARETAQGNFLGQNNGLEDVGLTRQSTGEGGTEATDCLEKVEMQDKLIYDEEERCVVINNEECHLSWVTRTKNQEVEECNEEHEKKCTIEVVEVPFTEMKQVCHQPMIRDCSITGEQICTSEVITDCSNNYQETTVEEDIPNCITDYKSVCNKDSEGNELTDPEHCRMVPYQKCTTMKMNVRKIVGEPSCKPKTVTVCGPEKCPVVPGEKVCHDEQVTDIKHELQESCSINPIKDCKSVIKPVPYLVQEKDCVIVPKEVCETIRVNPRTVQVPVLVEWCGPKSLVDEMRAQMEGNQGGGETVRSTDSTDLWDTAVDHHLAGKNPVLTAAAFPGQTEKVESLKTARAQSLDALLAEAAVKELSRKEAPLETTRISSSLRTSKLQMGF